MKTVGCLMVALSALATASSAMAQANYPDKPVRIIVGFAPGGPADIAARVVGEKLSEAWGKPVLVENVTGAGGNMATDRVAKAAPDGYTLALGSSGPFVIHPSLYQKLPFDPIKDFIPITQLCFTPNILVINNDVPAKSPTELAALAKAQPGKLTFASAGVGTTQHLAGELFKSMAGIDIQHVPYRGISGVMPDVLGGRLTMVFGNTTATLPLAREGKVRALAVTSPKRMAAIPDLATMAEVRIPRLRRCRVVRLAGADRHARADRDGDPPRNGAHPGAPRRPQKIQRARHGDDRQLAGGVRRRHCGRNAEVDEAHQRGRDPGGRVGSSQQEDAARRAHQARDGDNEHDRDQECDQPEFHRHHGAGGAAAAPIGDPLEQHHGDQETHR